MGAQRHRIMSAWSSAAETRPASKLSRGRVRVGSSQDGELLPEHEVLQDEGALAAATRGERSNEQPKPFHRR